MTKSKIFLLTLLSFIGGVALHSFIRPPIALATGVLLFGAAVAVYSFFIRYRSDSWEKFIFGVLILFVFLGLFRSADVMKNGNIINPVLYDQDVIFAGKIIKEPDRRDNFSQYTMENQKIGRVLIKTELYPEYFYGDILEIKGKILEPENDFPTLRSGPRLYVGVDYKNYLAKDDIYSVVRYPEIKLIGSGEKNLMFYLLAFKHSFTEKINVIFSEPQASLLSALLVGARRTLPENLTNAFKRTGTSHIVAISGYNISIIAIMAINFLSYLLFPKKLIFWIVGIAILLFTLIAGAEASVVRAAIMGGLLMLGRREGRFYDVANAVILAAAVMLFFNPRLLRYDAGFQLSFLATLGLIYISPHFAKRFSKLPNFLSFRDNLTATVSAQIATFPVIFFGFGNFSLVAVLANVMVLPAIPPTMLFGFLAGLSSFISFKIGTILAFPAYLLLSYQIWLVKFLSLLPFASI